MTARGARSPGTNWKTFDLDGLSDRLLAWVIAWMIKWTSEAFRSTLQLLITERSLIELLLSDHHMGRHTGCVCFCIGADYNCSN
jgi:hypothetical protein